jgi:hypothetical protein
LIEEMKKYILLHVLCGLLAVYLSGIADREMKTEGSAPCGLLFVTGPLGLAISVGVLVIIRIANHTIKVLLKNYTI